jgi:hypothetical protein
MLRIIQDCEDALTNWVPQNAAVSAKLSARARNLSQRRQSRIRGEEGHDLSHQDRPMDHDSWPTSERTDGYDGEESAHGHQDSEDLHHDESNAEYRGREERRPIAA